MPPWFRLRPTAAQSSRPRTPTLRVAHAGSPRSATRRETRSGSIKKVRAEVTTMGQSSQINFGYPWFLSYGHLAVAAVALSFWLLGRARKWSKAPMVLIGAVTLWSLAAFLVARFAFDVNGRLPLPTQRFLASGTGRVLDMGVGTGRSSFMVLEA